MQDVRLLPSVTIHKVYSDYVTAVGQGPGGLDSQFASSAFPNLSSMLSPGQSGMMPSGLGQSALTSQALGQPGPVQPGMMPETMDPLLASGGMGGLGQVTGQRSFAGEHSFEDRRQA